MRQEFDHPMHKVVIPAKAGIHLDFRSSTNKQSRQANPHSA